jgi:hypothetical protein
MTMILLLLLSCVYIHLSRTDYSKLFCYLYYRDIGTSKSRSYDHRTGEYYILSHAFDLVMIIFNISSVLDYILQQTFTLL